ncbi:MAG TPA: FAD-dependent monooxygenase, partial [Longimicrobiales bacterium]
MPDDPANATIHLDVLIVGAGPTGLTLAAQLQRCGARFRIVDRLRERVHESRALAVQARSLEILDALGLAGDLVARGNPAVRVVIHLGREKTAALSLQDIGAPDTRFPFILFVSQAETEAVLGEHLENAGVGIERGVELAAFEMDDRGVTCTLRHDDGRVEHVRARYLAGCDGAHSIVRKGAGIPFHGGAYPQDFVLGDIEADGALVPGAVNAFPGHGDGTALFFPLGMPRPWRLAGFVPRGRPGARNAGSAPGASAPGQATAGEPAARTEPAEDGGPGGEPITSELSLAELQAVADAATGGRVRLRDPAWLTRFRLHHRQAATYR